MNRNSVRFSLFSVLLCLPIVAFSIGLGNLSLRSSLNEPLDATLDVVSLNGAPKETVRFSIATQQQFDNAGLSRPNFLNKIRFEWLTQADRVVVRLSTTELVKEPFLNFLIDVSWPNGHIIREYTVLLDPPTYANESGYVVVAPEEILTEIKLVDRNQEKSIASKPASPVEFPPLETVATPVTTQPRVSLPSPFSRASIKSSSPEIKQASIINSESDVAEKVANKLKVKQPSTSNAVVGDEVVVQRGDTLWAIAARVRQDNNVSMREVINAIVAENPERFEGKSINQLLVGERIKLPGAAKVGQIQRNKPLAPASQNPEPESVAVLPTWQSDVSPEEVETAVAATTEPQRLPLPSAEITLGEDKLQIIVPQMGQGELATTQVDDQVSQKPAIEEVVQRLRQQVLLTNESLDATKRQHELFAQELQELKATITDLRALLKLREAEQTAQQLEITELRNKLAEQSEAVAQSSFNPNTTQIDSQAKVSSSTQGLSAESQSTNQVKPDSRVAIDSEMAKLQTPGDGQQQNVIDDILQDRSLLFMLLLSLLILVVLIWMFMQRIMAHREKQSAMVTATGENLVQAVSSSEAQSSAAEHQPIEFALSEEPEPQFDKIMKLVDSLISEAQYHDAIELMQNAINRSEEPLPFHRRLCEVFLKTDEQHRLMQHIRQIPASIADPLDEDWAAIQKIKQQIEIDLADSKDSSEQDDKQAPEAFDVADFDELTADSPDSKASHEQELASDAPSLAEGESLEDDVVKHDDEVMVEQPQPHHEQAANAEQVEADEDLLTLDATHIIDFEPVEKAESPAATEEADEGAGHDDVNYHVEWPSIDLGNADPESATDAEIQPSDDATNDSTKMDEHDDEHAIMDEVTTKLDLARAYLDMSDSDGAKDILEEVLEEGNERQQAEAKQLMQELAS